MCNSFNISRCIRFSLVIILLASVYLTRCEESESESSSQLQAKELVLSEKAFLNDLLKLDERFLNEYIQRLQGKHYKRSTVRELADFKRTWNRKRPGWELAYGKRGIQYE